MPVTCDGGYLGVDLFFTVSGFLITRLILDDLGRGRFRLASFWARRARRLLPALWLLLAVMILMSPWLVERSSGPACAGPVVATAIYIANWWQLERPGLVLGGVRDAVAAEPHLEPGHRGAVLRGVAGRGPHRLEARPPAGPGAAGRGAGAPS